MGGGKDADDKLGPRERVSKRQVYKPGDGACLGAGVEGDGPGEQEAWWVMEKQVWRK